MQFLSPAARRLLYLANHARGWPDLGGAGKHEIILPAEAVQLCQRLRDVFDGDAANAAPSVWRMRNAWGGFTFRAHWLNRAAPEPATLIGITVRHHRTIA